MRFIGCRRFLRLGIFVGLFVGIAGTANIFVSAKDLSPSSLPSSSAPPSSVSSSLLRNPTQSDARRICAPRLSRGSRSGEPSAGELDGEGDETYRGALALMMGQTVCDVSALQFRCLCVIMNVQF